MMIFSLRREEGAHYPVILLDESQEAFRDDACGGYEVRGDAVKEVRNAYGQDAQLVTQSALYDEIAKRGRKA